MFINRSDRGTGLVEVLVAAAIVVTACCSVAALSSIALRTMTSARDRTLATLHAQSKLEQLLVAQPSAPLAPSDALQHDTPGWVEYLDAAGRVTGQDVDALGTVFVRRWSVIADASGPGLLRVEVRVGRCQSGRAGLDGCAMVGDGVAVGGLRSDRVW